MEPTPSNLYDGLSAYQRWELKAIQESGDPDFVQEWKERLGRMPDWMLPPNIGAMTTRLATEVPNATETIMAYDDYIAEVRAITEDTNLFADNGTWGATTEMLKTVGTNSTLNSPQAKVGQADEVSMATFTMFGSLIIGNYLNL